MTMTLANWCVLPPTLPSASTPQFFSLCASFVASHHIYR